MTGTERLNKFRIFLAFGLMILAIFHCCYSYGYMVGEKLIDNLTTTPLNMRFSTSSTNYHYDLLIHYLIISGCYFLYIIMIYKGNNFLNQLIGLITLALINYQVGIYSFIVGNVATPGRYIIWKDIVFPSTFIVTAEILGFAFWVGGIILLVTQIVTTWQSYKLKEKL